MRSRYSAYALGRADYLLQTWAAETRPPALDLNAPPCPQWLGLKILHSDCIDDAGTVEFVARYKINGRAERLHERSRFVRRQVGNAQRWFYLDGEFPQT